jgi:hypothetical protein
MGSRDVCTGEKGRCLQVAPRAHLPAVGHGPRERSAATGHGRAELEQPIWPRPRVTGASIFYAFWVMVGNLAISSVYNSTINDR